MPFYSSNCVEMFTDRIIKFMVKNPYSFYILIAIILVPYIFYPFLTYFERIITIKDKSVYTPGRINTVNDNNNNVYAVSNSPILLHFTSAELFYRINQGETYRIKGYGFRVPFLQMYPNVVGVDKL
jgi:hypothetical protein